MGNDLRQPLQKTVVSSETKDNASQTSGEVSIRFEDVTNGNLVAVQRQLRSQLASELKVDYDKLRMNRRFDRTTDSFIFSWSI